MIIMLALLLPVMLGLLGLAVDFSVDLRNKTALDQSLDAAVLAAVTQAEQVIQAQSNANFDATTIAIAAGQIAGQQVFLANSARVGVLPTPQLTLTMQRQGLSITANGSYTAQTPTAFGTMFGTAVLRTNGVSSSSLTMPKYINIYVGVDISQSMGIGATQTDMNNLSTKTGGCVFGCHVPQSGQSISYEQIAHNNGISLRIDVIRQAFQDMVSTAKSLSSGTPKIKIGLYSMQENIKQDGASAMNEISALSTNYDSLTSTSNALDLGPNDSSGVGDSDMSLATNTLNLTKVSASGDGSGANSPQTFVFLMTDGVSDVKGNCTDGHCTQAFDPRWCDGFKAKNVTVGVINTTYIPFPNEQTYRDLVAPFATQLAPNLQSCASSGYYYEASDGPAIHSAVQALFTQATSQNRLTQ